MIGMPNGLLAACMVAALMAAGFSLPATAQDISVAMLASHTALRAKHCVQPLPRSPALATLAQE